MNKSFSTYTGALTEQTEPQLPFADEEFWSEAPLNTSQGFPIGDLTFSTDLNDLVPANYPFSMELDNIEQVSHDAMLVDDNKPERECLDSVRELPEHLHDLPFTSSLATLVAPTIINIPMNAPVRKSAAHPLPSSVLIKMETEEDDSSDSSASRARKRPRIEMDVPEPASVKNIKTISERLTALDSDTFDDFIARIEAVRKLSSAEVMEVKKMKRRIANRESARKSRQEKREHTDLLDQQIRQLTDELHATKLEVASLAAQNVSLRSEIAFSYHLIAANPVLAQLYADLKHKHEQRRSSAAASSSSSSSSSSSTSSSGGH